MKEEKCEGWYYVWDMRRYATMHLFYRDDQLMFTFRKKGNDLTYEELMQRIRENKDVGNNTKND